MSSTGCVESNFTGDIQLRHLNTAPQASSTVAVAISFVKFIPCFQFDTVYKKYGKDPLKKVCYMYLLQLV